MITKTDAVDYSGRTISTYVVGTINLTPIEYQHIDEAILAQAGYVFGDDIPLDYCAHISWERNEVIVTIGDYIIAEWKLGKREPMVFNNAKGYGSNHMHSYIDTLPVAIVSDVVSLFWPAM